MDGRDVARRAGPSAAAETIGHVQNALKHTMHWVYVLRLSQLAFQLLHDPEADTEVPIRSQRNWSAISQVIIYNVM